MLSQVQVRVNAKQGLRGRHRKVGRCIAATGDVAAHHPFRSKRQVRTRARCV